MHLTTLCLPLPQILEGKNFGLAGFVKVVDADPSLGTQITSNVEATSWSHDQIEISYAGSAGVVTVHRGDQVSEEGSFERVAPSISALTGESGEATAFPTRGGPLLTLRGQVGIAAHCGVGASVLMVCMCLTLRLSVRAVSRTWVSPTSCTC